MGKRQRNDYLEDDDSSSTEPFVVTKSDCNKPAADVCVHIQHAFDLAMIQKQGKSESIDDKGRRSVVLCSESLTHVDVPDIDNTLWLCQPCGSQMCGSNKNIHPSHKNDQVGVNTRLISGNFSDVCDVPVNSKMPPEQLHLVDNSKINQHDPRSSLNQFVHHQQELDQCQMTDVNDTLRNLLLDGLVPSPETSEVSVDVPDARSTNSIQRNKSKIGIDINTGSIQAPIEHVCNATGELPPQATRQIVEYWPCVITNLANMVDQSPRLVGLSNLGNTCYFNAVLQCLAHTPYLLSVLYESANRGEKVHIPGGLLQLPDKTEMVVHAINGELEGWRSLTQALAEILNELTTSAKDYVSPKQLLAEVVSKWPQFDGDDQHDAHELLRHLLESVRAEDLRRYQALIMHELGLSERKSYRNVAESLTGKVRFYGEQITQWVYRPEQVFRGSLVSTLTCQDCLHTSSRHEYFLDISLPMCVERSDAPEHSKGKPEPNVCTDLGAIPLPAPLSTDTASHPADATKLTKAEKKKERNREKKAKRNAKQQTKTIILSSLGVGGGTGAFSLPADNTTDVKRDNLDVDNSNMLPSSDESIRVAGAVGPSDESVETSDADIEDNDVPDGPFSKDGGNNVSIAFAVDQNGNQPHSSGSVPEKMDYTPENPNKNLEGGINIVCTVGISAQRAKQMCKQLQQHSQLVGDSKATEVSSSTLQACPKQGSKHGTKAYSKQGAKTNAKEGAKVSAKLDGKTEESWAHQRSHNYADWSNTIAPRYKCVGDEYSIHSCLNNFTAVELMTGSNKVCCEACTERINGKGGKSVNTNATKQFLISVPPAVLILHVKRFQMGPRGIFRKHMSHVSFPLILDIASFCGSKVKRASHIRPGQKNILYSLYGVVEHTGSTQSGHYVAYVKVRPPFGADDQRWKFIPQGTKDELDRKSEQEMAREQALRMGVHLPDSDDSLSPACSDHEGDKVNTVNVSSENNQQHLRGRPYPDNEEEEEEEEGAVGYRPKQEPAPGFEPPVGKWYYVSDSIVHEVTEEKVLTTQAYLLFYERIF